MLRIEIAIEEVACGHQNELVEQIGLARFLEDADDFGAWWRGLQQPRCGDIGEVPNPQPKVKEALRISLAVALDLAQRLIDVLPEEHVAAILEEAETEDIRLVELEAEALQL